MSAQHRNSPRILDWLPASLSVLALFICLFYTYTAVYLVPYPGFSWGPSWTVDAFEPCEVKPAWCEANQDTLQVGDQLLVIGDLTHAEYRRDRSSVPFSGYNPGEFVPITFRRAGAEQTVNWQMLGLTDASQIRRLTRSLLTHAPFWLAGTLVLLFLRPRDLRWRLLISFNYATAAWLAAGVHSDSGIAYSSLVQHALAWLLLPVYLHLHLSIPTSLVQRHRRYFLPPLYAVAAILSGLELFQALPQTAFYAGLLLAFLGSLGLLVFRLLRRSTSDGPAARLMLAGIGLAFGPGIVLAVIPAFLGVLAPTGPAKDIAGFAVLLMPFFYIYASYKRQLGAVEFRANRLLTLGSFISLYVTAFVLVTHFGSQWLNVFGSLAMLNLVVSVVFVVIALPLYAGFQRVADRLAYGTGYNPANIIQVFVKRIPMVLDYDALAQMLADKAVPSLLIRQSALYLLADEGASLVYAQGIDLRETANTSRQIRQLLAETGRFRPPPTEIQDEFDWVRLAIPLEMRKRTLGIWLLGQRSPDDYYPQQDIRLLTTLAGQIAVAVENIQLYEQAKQEIDERKRSEKALLESEERLRTVVQDMPVMLDALDADYHIIAWNQECERVTGYSAEEIVGDPRALELLYPDADYLQRVLAEWGERGDFRDWELELTSKDGSTKTVAWSNMSKRFPIPGWAAWATGVDITERKRVEEALQESEEMAQAILNATTESVILVDDQMTILSLNQTAASRLRKSVDELVGMRLQDLPPELLPPALVESRVAQIREVIRSGRPAHFEDERAGMVFDTTVYPAFVEGKVKRLAIFAQDITAHRKAEQQAIRAERLAAMGYLATALAHEINNPLQTIRGYLEMLLTFSLGPGKQEEHLSITLEEVERLIGVTQRVLDFARPAKDTHHPVPVALLVQKTLSLMNKQLQLAHIHTTVNLPEDLPLVFAAPNQIIQVLLNLTTNAIQAMSNGGHLRITAHADGNMVSVALTNDSPHLTPEQIEHLFDPFFTTKPEGTGLGLSISLNIIGQHGGTISMENLEGEKGVTCTITLPTANLSEWR